MKTSREPIGRRLRFEVFKRDGFRCVYCGRTPVDAVLHIDHVHPVCEGGTNDPANLVTSCSSCNLGKAAVPLDRKAVPFPDPAVEAERLEQLKTFLAIQRELAGVRAAAVMDLADYWMDRITYEPSDYMMGRFYELIDVWGLAKLMEAVEIVARKNISSSHKPTAQRRQAQFFHAILRNWRGR